MHKVFIEIASKAAKVLAGVMLSVLLINLDAVATSDLRCNITHKCDGQGQCGGACQTNCVYAPECDKCTVRICPNGLPPDPETCECPIIVTFCTEGEYESKGECVPCPLTDNLGPGCVVSSALGSKSITSCFLKHSGNCTFSNNAGNWVYEDNCHYSISGIPVI